MGTAHSVTDYAGIVRLIPDPCTRVIGRFVHAAPARAPRIVGGAADAGCGLQVAASCKQKIALAAVVITTHTIQQSVGGGINGLRGVLCVAA